MKNIILTLTLTIVAALGFGQKNKYYKSIEEIQNAPHPDSVYIVDFYLGVDLEECKLVKWSKFKNISYLRITNTKIAAFPEWVFDLVSLNSLTINGLRKDNLNENGEFSKVSVIAPLNKIPERISELTNLSFFDISFTSVTEFPESILKLDKLKRIYFADCPISTIPKIIKTLAKKQQTICLGLVYNQIVNKKERKYLKKFDSGYENNGKHTIHYICLDDYKDAFTKDSFYTE
ncbi:MAG: hypothetical protein ACK5D5_09500 [Bacteroidota bacterium]|jgi:Leucine-rich repeat (LRR) protein